MRESDKDRRARILAECEERTMGVVAQRLKEARAQERAKRRPPIVYEPAAEKLSTGTVLR